MIKICPECGIEYVTSLDRDGSGRCIQDIHPNAEPWEREQLMSGLCSQKCWNKHVGDYDYDE